MNWEKTIDKTVKMIAEWSSYLIVFLIVLIVWDVLSRKFFGQTKVWYMEMEWHFFAWIMLMGLGYAWQTDRHVRVDLFYYKFSATKKAWINILGTIFFLWPICFFVINFGFLYAYDSWLIHESSPNPGGLAHRYIIKGSMVLGYILLALQSIVLLIRDIRTLQHPS